MAILTLAPWAVQTHILYLQYIAVLSKEPRQVNLKLPGYCTPCQYKYSSFVQGSLDSGLTYLGFKGVQKQVDSDIL